jgi:hypothetical protein
MDLFVVPTISFRLLYGLLIMGHGRRQLLWVGVTAHPRAEWIANQLTEACGWEQIPRYPCVPKIRFCNIDGEGRQGQVVRRRRRGAQPRDGEGRPCSEIDGSSTHYNRRHIRVGSGAVETFAADRAEESLNVSVLPGRSGCDRMVPNAHCTDPLQEGWTIAIHGR